MGIKLVGGASTRSRARRPLPPGAMNGIVMGDDGVREHIEFEYSDRVEQEEILSWVGGQAGLLWGHGPFPFEDVLLPYLMPGSYGDQSEHLLAEQLGAVYDGLLSSNDMAVRFFQNGSDACSAAVRVARAVTGLSHIATQGYHGVHLDFSHEPDDVGYPTIIRDMNERFEFGNVTMMQDVALRSSCLMVEVPPVPDNEARAFLRSCREMCDKYNIPFIIDDVVLGFRLELGGSCEYYGIKPDMACLGKAMSATGCVSALIGRADMVGRLGDDVFYSTTFGGAPGPCVIAAATIEWLWENREYVYGGKSNYGIGYLRGIGQKLMDGLNTVFIEQGRAARVIGQPVRSVLQFDKGDEARRAWCSEMIARGVMLDRPQFPTLAHTMADVEKTIEVARSVE